MKEKKIEIGIIASILPIIILIILLAINVGIYGDDSLNGSNQFILLIGAFIGAYLEEKDDLTKSFIIALGALAGFLSGTILKLAVSLYLTYEFIIVLLNG